MPSDDREDTATGVSAVGPSPADDDEEMKTAITAAPLDLLEQTAEDAPTGVTRAPSSPDTKPRPPSDDNPTAIARAPTEEERAAADEEVPTGVTAKPKLAAPSDFRQTQPDSAETKDVRHTDDDSIVTIQPVLAPAVERNSERISERKSASLPVPTPPPRAKDSDIYDADEDLTERRDLPTDEIKRAIERAKGPVTISEAPDDSPTARQRVPSDLAITPRTGVRVVPPGHRDDDDVAELRTETDVRPLPVPTRASAAPMRPPFATDAEEVATEPRIEKERDREERVLRTAVVPRSTVMSSMPEPPRPPPVRPIASTGDSFTFNGNVGELQAVIPVTTAPPNNSGPQAAQAAQAPQAGPSTSPPPPSQGMNAHSVHALAMMPTQPASVPPGLAASPQNGPGSMRMPISMHFPPKAHNALGGPHPPEPMGFGGAPPLPEPRGEPRWIVLVLGILVVCIIIPPVLYFVLRARTDESPATEPAKPVVSVQTASPKDVGKRR